MDVYNPGSFLRFHLDSYAGPDGGAVRSHSLKLDRNPAVAMPRILVQGVSKPIPRKEAAYLDEDVLVPISIDIPEGDAMALL